ERFAVGADMRARGIALLERLGVPAGRRTIATFSRGEQQRIALARALLFDPPVIVADEPTASLDATAGAAVAETLRQLSVQEGRTVIVASHDPALVGRCARRIALDHGRINADGAP